MEQFKTTTIIKQVIPAVTGWAVGKVLESPRVKQKVERIDKNVRRQRRSALKNAKRNRAWLAAGAAVMIIGAGLMAKSTRPK